MRDAQGDDRMLHSLDSTSYLKVHPANFVFYACQKMDRREVQINQEYKRKADANATSDENDFTKIFNIKICDVTLRELLLF